MMRHESSRVDSKRRTLNHRQKQFETAAYKDLTYSHRLNFYTTPPTADITLEQFEQWAIDRLRVLAELEACSFRNKTPDETASHMKPVLQKYLQLSANSSIPSNAKPDDERYRKIQLERQKDHYSHFILRLAFAQTEDLRKRYARAESMLFRLRLQSDDGRERQAFLQSLELDCVNPVSEDEKMSMLSELADVVGGPHNMSLKAAEDESWFVVDWTKVPDLVGSRKVLLKAGKAYVPGKEQMNLVVPEFTARLEKALELTARALPRLDEDDRLTPILNHLAQNFGTPDAGYASSSSLPSGANINAASIDALSSSFPLCMQSLHRTLRRDAHLKHFARLQYTLFLKGIGLSLDDCLTFWRASFRKITDDVFTKEYRYNIRHAYGDVGGDSNRRSGGHAPYSCQRILTERAPGPGENHGCPYRHYSADNLMTLLREVGVTDDGVLRGVKEDKENSKFHLACNRVFEHVHAKELKRAKEDGSLAAAGLSNVETIVHPNEYFKRSYVVRNLAAGGSSNGDGDVKMEG